MAKDRWSKRTPKRRGFYWHRDLVDGIEPYVVEVSKGRDGRQISSTGMYIDNWDGEWYGPITPPSE